jgi:hypothetical protein
LGPRRIDHVENRSISVQSRRVMRRCDRLGSRRANERAYGSGWPVGVAVGCGAVIRRGAAGLCRESRPDAGSTGHPLLLRLLMSRPICGGSTWLGTAGHLWRAGGGSGDVRCPLSMPPGLDTASAPGRACRAARELQEPVGAVEAAALATAPSPRTAVCGQMSRGPGRAPGRSALARNSGPASVSGWRTSSARALRRPGAADHAGNESAAFIAGLRDWPARFRRRAPIPCPDPEGDTW